MCLILNGNLVLRHRFAQLSGVITNFNESFFKGKVYEHSIKLKERLILPSLDDGWLSGFTDAEGHFGCPVETTRKHISHYISLVFELGQNGEVLF